MLEGFDRRHWRDRHRVGAAWSSAEGHDGQRHQRRPERDRRREHVEDLVDVRRDHFLLEEELAAVRERLEQPARPDAVRPDAVLHPRGEFSLAESEVRAHAHHAGHEADDQHGGVDQVE